MSLNYAENVNSFGTLGGWPISESNLRPLGNRNELVLPKILIGQSGAIFSVERKTYIESVVQFAVHLVFVLRVVIETEDVGPAGDHPLVVVHHVLQRLPVLNKKEIRYCRCGFATSMPCHHFCLLVTCSHVHVSSVRRRLTSK